MASAHVLNFHVSTIFCILWYLSCCECQIMLFYFLFSCINLCGIVPGLTQGVDKGRWRLTLCGPCGHMWTRMGKILNGVKMSWKGWCIWSQEHTTKIEMSHVVPTLKPMANKGDPTGLGYKGNHGIRHWRQEYKPSPLFPLNPPTNPCPKVPMKSKQNYSTKLQWPIYQYKQNVNH